MDRDLRFRRREKEEIIIKKVALILVVLLFPFLFGGCFDRQIFENTAVIIYAGAETGAEDKFLFSFAAADAKKEDDLFIVAQENDLMESAVADLTSRTENPLRAGKIQNLLFSEELAEDGILKIRDANRMNVANRYLADYAIVKGSPLTLLNVLKAMDIGGDRYCYLDKALSNGADAGICPNTLKHEFNIDFETEGIDPILPLISCDEKNLTVTVEGTALFDGDRCVGSLDREQSRYLSLLSSSAKNVRLDITDLRQKGDHVTMNVVSSKHKIKIRTAGEDIVIDIGIKLRSCFDVSDWQEILEKRQKNEARRLIEKSVGRKCGEVMSILQKRGCDPFGVGASLRGFHPDIAKETDLKSAYQNAVVRIEIENRIINHEV